VKNEDCFKETTIINIIIIVIIVVGIEALVSLSGIAWLEYFRYKFSYDDLRLIVQLFTGVAPFVAAFSAYWMWSKNREKEIKKYEYKKDYHKKIIDRRLNAYDTLGELLHYFDKITAVMQEKGKEIHFDFKDKDKDKIKVKISEVIKCRNWLDKETNIKVTDFVNYIENIIDENIIGGKKCEQIINDKNIIEEMINNDFKKLHKIDKFQSGYDKEEDEKFKSSKKNF